MKILDKWIHEGLVSCIGYSVDDGFRTKGPYTLYAINKFKAIGDAEDHVNLLHMLSDTSDTDINKIFYDPTDVDDHPWIVCSWAKVA